MFSMEATEKNVIKDDDIVRTAQATDLAFNMLRQKAEIKNGWTEFNQLQSTNEQDVTTVGYMPILQAPAHEFDTLNTCGEKVHVYCSHVWTKAYSYHS